MSRFRGEFQAADAGGEHFTGEAIMATAVSPRAVADEPELLGGRVELRDAIRGTEAFGRFKDASDRRGLLPAWATFRRSPREAEARAWLGAEGVPFGP